MSLSNRHVECSKRSHRWLRCEESWLWLCGRCYVTMEMWVKDQDLSTAVVVWGRPAHQDAIPDPPEPDDADEVSAMMGT